MSNALLRMRPRRAMALAVSVATAATLGITMGPAGVASASPDTSQGIAYPPERPCYRQLDQSDPGLWLFDSCTLYISLHDKIPDIKQGDPATVESKALAPEVNQVQVDSIAGSPFFAFFVDVQVHENTPPGTYPITVKARGKTVHYELKINNWGVAELR